ncbi:DEAD/DEAH box helicase [Xanthobacter sp. KR7-65]|uniref:DEAD/DEAH box helicase n=1 Tax=Xanthobacter sp. KR7-65 TaxID=3156612 RepID=UPI0032B583FC
MKIQYIDAPAGSGKTHAICKLVADMVNQGQKIILVQPTKALIDQTYSTLSFNLGLTQQVQKIYSQNESSKSAIQAIVEKLKNPPFGGVAILITQAAFDGVPYFEKAGQWHLIFDEVPAADAVFMFRVPHSHSLITRHLEIGSDSPYALVTIDLDQDDDILKLGSKDDVYRRFYPVARRIKSEGWDAYVDVAQYQRLLVGDIGSLSIYAVRNEKILSRFKSCIVASARFLESLFCKIMQARGATFEPYPLTNNALRYTSHNNGALLTIHYMPIDRWSKKAAAEHPDLLIQLKQFIKFKFHNRPFIYLGNKGSGHFDLESAGGIELSGSPHGLNHYQHLDHAAIFPAYNPRPPHAKFLASLGVSSEVLDTAMHCNAIYQALMRCSLRDPQSTSSKVAIAPDRRTAMWLQGVFPGATVEEISLAANQTIGKVGRRRKYSDNAERQREYRARKKAAAAGTFASAPLLETAFPQIQPRYESIKENNVVTQLATSQKGIWRMNIYKTVKSRGAYEIVALKSLEEIVKAFKAAHRVRLTEKNSAKLFNFTIYSCDPKTTRKAEDAIGSSVLILDNDGDGISPEEFMDTFSSWKMILANTFSSTGGRKRWRAVIPLARNVSVDEYAKLYNLVLHELKYGGYPVDKKDPSKPYDQPHGFDTSKRTVVSIFYLPSQAKDPNGTFFHAATGPQREILDPDVWLTRLPPVSSPSVVPALPKAGHPTAATTSKLSDAVKTW